MRDKVKLFWLTVGGFFASVTPLLAVLVANRARYFSTSTDSVKLCFGGGIVAVLLFLKVIGRLKIPGDATVVGVVMLLSYLLAPVLDDLTLLCGAYLVGSLAEMIAFRRPAKRLREKMKMNAQADTTAGRVENLLKNYIGNGRV